MNVSQSKNRLLRFGTRWWYRLIQTAARLLGAALFQMRAYGRENVPATGGVVLASNHQSLLDPALIGACLHRETHYMARSTLFRIPVFSTLIVTLNAFPIERDIRDVKGVKESLKRLKAGHALLVFPEGTRTRDGTVGPMKAGIRFLAERAAVPIVPVLIEGAFGVWPRTQWLPEPGEINVLFGPPIEMGEREDFGPRLREAVRALHSIPHRRTQRSV